MSSGQRMPPWHFKQTGLNLQAHLSGIALCFSSQWHWIFLTNPQAQSFASLPLPREKAGGNLPTSHTEEGSEQLQQNSWTLANPTPALPRAWCAHHPLTTSSAKSSLDLAGILESSTWGRLDAGSLQPAQHRPGAFTCQTKHRGEQQHHTGTICSDGFF